MEVVPGPTEGGPGGHFCLASTRSEENFVRALDIEPTSVCINAKVEEIVTRGSWALC